MTLEPELAGAWAAFLAGAETEGPAAARLAEAMAASDGLTRELADDASLHGALAAMGRGEREGGAFLSGVEALVVAERAADPFVAAVEQRVAAARTADVGSAERRRARRLAGVGVGVAAAALAAVWWPRQERPAPPLAEVAVVTMGTPRVDGAPAAIGAGVRAGMRLSADRRTCLEFVAGGKACLGPGATVRLDAPPSALALDRGEAGIVITRDVVQPFGLALGDVEVTARAAIFSVAADEPGVGPSIRVHDGSVDVRMAARGERPAHARRVSAGYQFAPTSGRLRALPAGPDARALALIGDDLPAPDRAVVQAPPAAAPAAPPPGDRRAALVELARALSAEGRVAEARGILEGLVAASPAPEARRLLAAARAEPPSSRPTPAVYRVNAGGPAFVDPEGNAWSADAFFAPGSGTFAAPGPIDRTRLDPLYEDERSGIPGAPPVRYSVPVSDGTYELRLHFAEIFFGWPGRRVADVVVEGVTRLAGYDVAREVGPRSADVRQFVVEVRDGVLDFHLTPVVGNPQLAGFEVFALPPGTPRPPALPWTPPAAPLPLPPTDAIYRVNAGGADYVDPQGRLWSADAFHNSGDAVTSIPGVDVVGTTLDAIYRSYRSDTPDGVDLAYRFPVAAGEYVVRLHFAEVNAKAGPGRRFDVVVEGETAIAGLDVAGGAGFGHALVREVRAAVHDGILDLEFGRIAGNPLISAIEILPVAGR